MRAAYWEGRGCLLRVLSMEPAQKRPGASFLAPQPAEVLPEEAPPPLPQPSSDQVG